MSDVSEAVPPVFRFLRPSVALLGIVAPFVFIFSEPDPLAAVPGHLPVMAVYAFAALWSAKALPSGNFLAWACALTVSLAVFGKFSLLPWAVLNTWFLVSPRVVEYFRRSGYLPFTNFRRSPDPDATQAWREGALTRQKHRHKNHDT